jgi:ketosteroid isomerase-like protein
MEALGKIARHFPPAVAVIIGLLLFSTSALAQKNKKTDDSTPLTQGLPPMAVPDSQTIDHDIGEMLGAFQVGNVEAMHKYYADNATFVRGTFDPPLIGWANYVKMYQQQRAAFPGMQLIRRNTSIFVHADVSWVSFQWEFESSYNGKPFSARGQTTLVLTKVGDNWLIVHNHTSEICPDASAHVSSQAQPPQNATQPATDRP